MGDKIKINVRWCGEHKTIEVEYGATIASVLKEQNKEIECPLNDPDNRFAMLNGRSVPWDAEWALQDGDELRTTKMCVERPKCMRKDVSNV